jgi:hypothetical protein
MMCLPLVAELDLPLLLPVLERLVGVADLPP